MSKIEVRNTSIIINNYEAGDNIPLERQFCIYDKLYHKFKAKAIFYDGNKKTLRLPRGIDVSYIEYQFGEIAEYINECDEYDIVDPIMIKYLPRDEVQQKALQFMLGLDEYRNNLYQPQLSVNLNTGAGKTYVSIAMSSYLRERTIVITSSIDWLEQWKARIMEYTDTTKDEIYILSGASSIDRLFMQHHDITKIKYLLASHMTLKSYAKKNPNKLTELFKYFRVGLKIYDEAHIYFDNIVLIDSYTNTKKTIYLTATPARSDKSEDRIYQLVFKNVPKINLFDEDKDPHTKCISIHYNSHPTMDQIQKCKNAYGFNRLNYIDYIITRPNLYKLIFVIMDLCIPLGGKILFYIGKIEAIAYIADWMRYNFPLLANDIAIFNSTVSKEEKEMILRDKRIILSTTKSCGAAMDIQGLKCTVVLTEPIGSPVVTQQSFGRTRDDNTYYIDVVDEGFPALRRYHENKKEIFDKYATECIEVNVDDIQLEQKYTEAYFKFNGQFMQYINTQDTKEFKTIATRIE